MSELTRLLKALGRDSKLHDDYVANPEGIMKEHGLDEKEIRAMLDKDLDKLRELSGLEELKSNSTVSVCD